MSVCAGVGVCFVSVCVGVEVCFSFGVLEEKVAGLLKLGLDGF